MVALRLEMRNATVKCPKCGLAVPAGMATCPRDETPLDGSAFAQTLVHPLSPDGARDAAPSPRASGEHPWVDPEPPAPPPAPRVPSVAHADPMIGMQLGEYKVEALIGVGGMGLVYRGVQPVIGKPVAIKVLRPEISESPSHMERLLVEARAVNAIRHRGIIDIFSFGQLPDGRQYFVMEYLNGQALDEHIQTHGPLPPNQAVAYLQEMASALHAAHVAGVVHRDLKTNNVFLVKQSGGKYVKLLDFGLAKQGVAAHGTTPQTQMGLVVGTPEFIAPEQARGEDVGPRTDLYSLGVVAFQIVTGQLPFTGKTPMDFVVAHMQTQPPKAIELMPDIPEQLSELIDRMMEKAPEMRPASADVVRRELKAIGRLLPQDTTFVGAAPQPEPPPPAPASASPEPAPHRSGETTARLPPPLARASRRRVVAWAGGGAFLVAAAGGASFLALRAISEPAPAVAPPPAVVEPFAPPPPPPPPPPTPPPDEAQVEAAPPQPEPPAAAQTDLAEAHDSPPATSPAARPERTRPGRNRVATPVAATPGPLELEREKLLQRLRELSRALAARSRSGTGDPKKTGALVARAERDARAAQDEAALTVVERQIRSLEEMFLARP